MQLSHNHASACVSLTAKAVHLEAVSDLDLTSRSINLASEIKHIIAGMGGPNHHDTTMHTDRTGRDQAWLGLPAFQIDLSVHDQLMVSWTFQH